MDKKTFLIVWTLHHIGPARPQNGHRPWRKVQQQTFSTTSGQVDGQYLKASMSPSRVNSLLWVRDRLLPSASLLSVSPYPRLYSFLSTSPGRRQCSKWFLSTLRPL